jgi:hypothetical protein
MLSFDDASAGDTKEAMPPLAKRDTTGCLLVMTVALGKGMSTRDIKRLADAGMTIGLHI